MDMLNTFVALVVGFILGAMAGVWDCKRTFGIPPKATAEDGSWLSNDEQTDLVSRTIDWVNGVEDGTV